MSQVKFDFQVTAEGLAKVVTMHNIPRAHRKILTEWLTGVKYLSTRNAMAMQKSGGKSKGGSSMGRNVGMTVTGSDDNFIGAVGTGIGGTQSVKYARIQDKGGTIIAGSKYLTIPFPGVTGTARSQGGKTFFTKTASGKLLMGEKLTGGGVKWLFLLREFVRIPATNWFTGAVETNKPLLDEMMKPANVLRYAAERMGGR